MGNGPRWHQGVLRVRAHEAAQGHDEAHQRRGVREDRQRHHMSEVVDVRAAAGFSPPIEYKSLAAGAMLVLSRAASSSSSLSFLLLLLTLLSPGADPRWPLAL